LEKLPFLKGNKNLSKEIDRMAFRPPFTQNKNALLAYMLRKGTVGENIIATIKMLNNICYPLKMLILK
jgi:hypothetical protein